MKTLRINAVGELPNEKIDSLIQAELLIALLGMPSDEAWNNKCFNDQWPLGTIYLNILDEAKNCNYYYCSIDGVGEDISLSANDLEKIQELILKIVK